MSCRTFRLQISALADASLEPDLIPEIQAHLKACAACAGFYEKTVAMNRLLQKTRLDLDPPFHVWQRIEAEISRSGPHRISGSLLDRLVHSLRSPVWQGALAGLFVAILLTLFLIQREPPIPPDSQILAELEAYQLAVTGNPFLPDIADRNPFFSYEEVVPANPFERVGGLK